MQVPTKEQLAQRGREVRQIIQRTSMSPGGEPPPITGRGMPIPGYSEMVNEYAFGGVWPRPNLSIQDRAFAMIGMSTALGIPQVAGQTRHALNAGISPTQILDAMIMLDFLAGWSTVSAAMSLAQDVFKSRPEWEAAFPKALAKPRPTDEERLQKARAVRQELWGARGTPWTRGMEQLVPDFAALVDAHLFGEMYDRPSLDARQRAIVCLAALCALKQETVLRHHVEAALRVGLTKAEIAEVMVQASIYSGAAQAATALDIVQSVVSRPQRKRAPRRKR